MKFSELGLNDQVVEAIDCMGFETATPIQEKAIPEVLKGRDVLGCAQTGTGKTAAFILPVLHKIAEGAPEGTNTLVIVPTRELALQIDQQIQGFAYFIPATSYAIYGGGEVGDWKSQKTALTTGTEIIVATPGKLISHLIQGNFKFDNLQHLILDEADRMLDMGFYEDICRIMSYLPVKRQNLMFSATMPPKIRKLATETLENPFEVTIAISKPSAGVLQGAYMCFNDQKIKLILSLIKGKEDYKSIIIFSSTKKNVFEIVRALTKAGQKADGISSDLEQKERESALLKFRTKETRIVVATDVISRGIDIKDINLVINFDVPMNAEDYVHRVGRTARADTTGVALTLINPDDVRRFQDIERLIESEVPKMAVPTELGPVPEWRKTNFKQSSGGGGGGKKKWGNKKKFSGKRKFNKKK